MTTPATDVLQAAATVLNDIGAVRWTVPELVNWLNEAQLVAVTQMPSINTAHQELTLTQGVLQEVRNVVALMDVVGNSTGARRAITPVKQELLDRQIPGWQGSPPSGEVLHWMRDARDPLRFLVYPPAKDGIKLNVMVSAFPERVSAPGSLTRIADVAGNIGLRDDFSPALVNYVVYRCLSKDAEYGGNQNRIMAHYAMFSQGIGAKTAAGISASQTQGAAS